MGGGSIGGGHPCPGPAKSAMGVCVCVAAAQVGDMMGCTLEQARAAAAEADTAAQMARAFEVRPTDLSLVVAPHLLIQPPLPSCSLPHPARCAPPAP